jgi:hypothetical protein
MKPNEIRERLRTGELPIRVVTSSGESYTIRIAEFAVITPTALYIFAHATTGGGIAEGPPAVLAIRNIAALEPLTPQAA